MGGKAGDNDKSATDGHTQLGGPAGEFPANILQTAKIKKNSEKILCANNNNKTGGPRTDGGERFRP